MNAEKSGLTMNTFTFLNSIINFQILMHDRLVISDTIIVVDSTTRDNHLCTKGHKDSLLHDLYYMVVK